MELYQHKEFLTIDDLINVFNKYHKNTFQIEDYFNRKTIFQTLLDLMQENKITPLFYYNGVIGDIRHQHNTEFYRGYFVCDTEVISNYERTKALVIKTERPYNAYYRYIDYKPYRLTDPSNISKSIYFHRQEIDKLFNQATDLNAQLANLSQQIADLNAQLVSRDNQIADLTVNDQKQADTIQQLNKRLEAGTPAEPIADNPLSIIMDTTKTSYAPDLAYSVSLWLDLYHHNPTDKDSHTNRANKWIKNNTGYTENDTQTISRIREVTTPLEFWGGKRSRETKK